MLCYQASGNATVGVRNDGTAVRAIVIGGGSGSQFLVPIGGMNIAGGISISGGATINGGATITAGDITIDATQSYVIGSDVSFYRNGPSQARTDAAFIMGSDLIHLGAKRHFTVIHRLCSRLLTGSRGGNAALASLLSQLNNLGLIIDNSTP